MAPNANNSGSDDVQTVKQLPAPRPNTTGPQKSEYSRPHRPGPGRNACAQGNELVGRLDYGDSPCRGDRHGSFARCHDDDDEDRRPTGSVRGRGQSWRSHCTRRGHDVRRRDRCGACTGPGLRVLRSRAEGRVGGPFLAQRPRCRGAGRVLGGAGIPRAIRCCVLRTVDESDAALKCRHGDRFRGGAKRYRPSTRINHTQWRRVQSYLRNARRLPNCTAAEQQT